MQFVVLICFDVGNVVCNPGAWKSEIEFVIVEF